MNKRMKQLVFLFFSAFAMSQTAMAQEMLPDFSVYKVGGGRVVISWVHNFTDVKQISIQRSHNKINFFKTIANMPDPSIQQNGLSDIKAPNDSMFYRIFVMREGGRFFTTDVKQPSVDSLGLAGAYGSTDNANTDVNLNTNFLPAGFVQSKYVYTSPDRYVRVELPFDSKKYDIKFFTENNAPLFELNNLKERRFKLDRSYFISAGYINFELYADNKLVEKHKLFLPKEF